MATARSVLKTYFLLGLKPTQTQFEELIDALVHVDDDLSVVLGALANINEAEQGIAVDKYMSAFLTKVAIDFQVKGNVPVNRNTLEKIADVLDPHLLSTSNPHAVTKLQIGLGNLPNAKSDSYTLDDSDTLATSKAVRSARLQNYNLLQLKQNSSNASTWFIASLVPNPVLYNSGTILLKTGTPFRIYIKGEFNWREVYTA